MNKILLITPYTPDNQGIGVSYTSQLIKELSKKFIIDIVYFKYKEDTLYIPYNKNIRILRETIVDKLYKIRSLLHNPWCFPLFSARFDKDTAHYLQTIATIDNYEYIYLDFSQTFLYANYINHPNLILMSHDVIAQKYSRMQKYFRPWATATESKLLSKGSVVFTFSQKDSDLINKLYGIKSQHTSFFLNKNVQEAIPKIKSDYFVFFGSWSRTENSEGLDWFIDNVLYLIPESISFKVIGGGLSEKIKSKINSIKNIEYLGFVENPYQIIADAKAEIAPLFKGAGVKVKCIEALASGTPIIGTDVAMEGIEDFSQYFTIAQTPQDFAYAINNCDYSLQQKIDLKKIFLNSYNNKKILQYIETNSNQ